jgi:hypothetical protein
LNFAQLQTRGKQAAHEAVLQSKIISSTCHEYLTYENDRRLLSGAKDFLREKGLADY